MLVAVISDTHLPSRSRGLSTKVWQSISGADHILHAGDVCTPSILDELAEVAPVHAVMGNCDPPEVARWGATDTLSIELDGVAISMVHDSGPTDGRRERMRKWFPDARVVVFGHSHMPVASDSDGLLLLNPGSPTDRRRAPTFTIALLELNNGQPTATLVEV